MRIIIVERRTIRIAKRDGYILILRLQAKANAPNGAARTRSAGEAVDPAVHLRPDFLRCTAAMRPTIGAVFKLVGPDGVFRLFRAPARRVPEVPWICIRRRGDRSPHGKSAW